MTRLDRINERLNLKEFQLGALLDVTKAINNNLQREELLKLYADIMHDELGITRLMLFEHSGGWRCAHAFGADESRQNPGQHTNASVPTDGNGRASIVPRCAARLVFPRSKP